MTSINTQDADRPAAQGPKKSVVVIGGGLAGIACALSLAKRGAAVQLLESKRRLGGRAGSFVTRGSSGEETIDYCQHVGMGCCHGLLRLIEWLHHEHYWDRQQQLHFYGPSGDYQRLGALPLVPAPLHLATWLVRWPGLTMRDRLAIATGMLKIRRLKINDAMDDISAETWLTEAGQTPQAIERFWSTIIVSALGEQTQRVSLASVCKVLQDGFLARRDAFHLLVPNRPLDWLFNEGAERSLREAGVQVQLSTPANKISETSGASGWRIDTPAGPLAADAVVIALPWHQVEALEIDAETRETDDKTRAIADVRRRASQLESSPISGVHTWWDREWLTTPHAAIVGRLCQWVFPKPSENLDPQTASIDASGNSRQHYYQIVISASRDLPARKDGELARALHEDLANVFPQVREARLLRHKVVTDPHAVFSVAPGALRNRACTRTSLPGIFLAGDWTQTGWPATMEGAILSGFAAADQAALDWNCIVHPAERN